MEEKTPAWFREGLNVTCKIYNTSHELYKVTDAKLHCENNEWFICQNETAGKSCKDKLSYKYSWYVGKRNKINLNSFRVFNLKSRLNKEMLLQIKEKINER